MGNKKSSGKNISAADLEWLGPVETASVPLEIEIHENSFSSTKPENLFPQDTAKDETLLKRQANNKRMVDPIFATDKQLNMPVFDFSTNEQYKSLDDYFDAQKEDYGYSPRRFTGKFGSYSKKEWRLREQMAMSYIQVEEDGGDEYLGKEKKKNKGEKEQPQAIYEERPSHRRKNILDHVRDALTIYKKSPDYMDYRREKPVVVITPCRNTNSGIWVSVMPKSKAKEEFKKFQQLKEVPVYNPERAMVHKDPAAFFAENVNMVGAMNQVEKAQMLTDLLPKIPAGKEVSLMVEIRDNSTGFELVAYDNEEIGYIHAKRAKQYWNNRQKKKQQQQLEVA